AGGAGGDAAHAGAAMILGQGHRVDLEVAHQLAEEEVRARVTVQDERVLRDPADAGTPRPFALEDRAGVDVREVARAGKAARQHGGEAIETRLDVAVIVRADRVAGDAAAQPPAPVARRGRRRPIRKPHADEAPCPRELYARIEPDVGALLQ